MKKALIVVDFQNDFIDGALGFPEAPALRPVIRKKIEKALAEGSDVIFTMDTHGQDYLDTVEGRGIPVVHCVKGTRGWELDDSVKEFIPAAKAVIEKPGFGSAALGVFAEKEGYTDIELCGLVTSLCVLNNAVIVKAHLPECSILVDSGATEDVNPAVKRKALDTMKSFMIKIL